MASPLDVAQVRLRVQDAVEAQLRPQRGVLEPVGRPTDHLLDAVSALLSGGKRLRAAFLYWGYRAVGGDDSDALVRAAASMEMFQAAALIHDDVMDGSAIRRGRPSVHRELAELHAANGWAGDSERFGIAGAILAGDLCLTWTDEMYATSGLPAAELARGRNTFDRMRTQLMGGQYLDVLDAAMGWEQASTDERIERARHVARVKSARYTVEQPLLIGARCAGASDVTAKTLAAYGLALGEAFQLRDDLLGVFGDPVETGKPAGDDLREGKRTVLIAHTVDRLDGEQLALFESLFGSPDLTDEQIEELRSQITSTGAVRQVEALIDALADDALAALQATGDLRPEPRSVLTELVSFSTDRVS